MNIVAYIVCKSLETALKSAGSVENRKLRTDLAQIKENIDKGVIKVVIWIGSKEQLSDSLTKQNSNKRVSKLYMVPSIPLVHTSLYIST